MSRGLASGATFPNGLLGVAVCHGRRSEGIGFDTGIEARAYHHADDLTDEVAGLSVFAYVEMNLYVQVGMSVLGEGPAS